jgi:hypothetical protein
MSPKERKRTFLKAASFYAVGVGVVFLSVLAYSISTEALFPAAMVGVATVAIALTIGAVIAKKRHKRA